MVLDLNWAKKKDVIENLGSMSFVDERLMCECAYYPRPPAFGQPSPCLQCSFDNPNSKCKRSHILTLTPLVEHQTRREKREPNLVKLLKGLPKEDVELIMEYIKQRKEVR